LSFIDISVSASVGTDETLLYSSHMHCRQLVQENTKKSRQLSLSNVSRCVFINKQTRWIVEHMSAVAAETKALLPVRLIKNHSKIMKLLQFE